MTHTRNSLMMLFVLICVNSHAQVDSVALKTSEILIYEMEDLINTTRTEIEIDDNKNNNNISADVKKMNEKNCAALYDILKVLKPKLYEEHGLVENVKYQIEPFMISIQKCISTLEVLTTHPKGYVEVEKVNYETAYLFKEIAKGNLFRVIGERQIKPKLFSVSLSLGYHANPTNTLLTDAYKQTPWKNETGNLPDFTNQKKNQNLFYNVSIDYRISKKATTGIGLQSLPTSNTVAQILIDDTVDLYDYASEAVSGYAVNLHAGYILKNRKQNGKGIEVALEGCLQLNNYLLEREIVATVSKYSHSYLIFQRIAAGGGGQVDTIEVYNTFSESLSQKKSLHSISFGINVSASYLISKLFSINATFSQYIDTGASVEEFKFYSRNLPSYTIKLSAFTARVGIGLHF
jgi:hypothetical protein